MPPVVRISSAPVHDMSSADGHAATSWQLLLLFVLLHARQAAAMQTNSADTRALTAISGSMSPQTMSNKAATLKNWTSIDPCGSASCGEAACRVLTEAVLSEALNTSTCNWGGICCDQWHVTGISLLPRVLGTAAGQSRLPQTLASMERLKVLKMAKQG